MTGDLDEFLDEVRTDSAKAGKDAVAAFDAYLNHFGLANEILELRKARRWSQQSLAARSGIQQSEISRIERGESNPTYQTLSAIAGAFDRVVGFLPAPPARSARVRQSTPVKAPAKATPKRAVPIRPAKATPRAR